MVKPHTPTFEFQQQLSLSCAKTLSNLLSKLLSVFLTTAWALLVSSCMNEVDQHFNRHATARPISPSQVPKMSNHRETRLTRVNRQDCAPLQPSHSGSSCAVGVPTTSFASTTTLCLCCLFALQGSWHICCCSLYVPWPQKQQNQTAAQTHNSNGARKQECEWSRSSNAKLRRKHARSASATQQPSQKEQTSS